MYTHYFSKANMVKGRRLVSASIRLHHLAVAEHPGQPKALPTSQHLYLIPAFPQAPAGFFPKTECLPVLLTTGAHLSWPACLESSLPPAPIGLYLQHEAGPRMCLSPAGPALLEYGAIPYKVLNT